MKKNIDKKHARNGPKHKINIFLYFGASQPHLGRVGPVGWSKILACIQNTKCAVSLNEQAQACSTL